MFLNRLNHFNKLKLAVGVDNRAGFKGNSSQMALIRLRIADAPAQLRFVELLSSCGVLFAHLLNRGRPNHHAIAFAETLRVFL